MTLNKPPNLTEPQKDEFETTLKRLSKLDAEFIKICDTSHTNIVVTKPVLDAIYEKYVEAFEKASELVVSSVTDINVRQKDKLELHRQIKEKLQEITQKDDPVIDEAKKVIAVVSKLISDIKSSNNVSYDLNQLEALEIHLIGQLKAFAENKMTVKALETTCQHSLTYHLDNVDKHANFNKPELMDARKNQYLSVLVLIDSLGLKETARHHEKFKEHVLSLQNSNEKQDVNVYLGSSFHK